MQNQYDVVVLGSGLAGTCMALTLSRVGISCLVVERGKHPRFAIGESMVPAATLGFDELSYAYDIPEFREVFHYIGTKSHGLAGFPKTNFWFGHHQPGEPLPVSSEFMFETLKLPRGPDMHLLRSDVDAFLVSRLPDYGVDYADETTFTNMTAGERHVDIELKDRAGETREVRAKLLVDATGFGSPIAKRDGLRHETPQMRTNTRSVFGHFTGVPALDEVLPPVPEFRVQRQAGTQHHCSDGAWIWSIPFDNDVTSVGVVFDCEKFPLDKSISPEEELRQHIARFPTIQAHLGNMRPVRDLIRTPRVQLTSRTMLGDGYILTPHAACFVDALFSSGIMVTQTFISRFVPIAKKVLSDPDYSLQRATDAFRPLEAKTFAETDVIDQVVGNVIKAFRHPEVFKQFWRTFIYAHSSTLTLRVRADCADLDGPSSIYGESLPAWRDALNRMEEALHSYPGSDLELARHLKGIMDELGHPHRAANYEVGSARPCVVPNADKRDLYAWAQQLRPNPPFDPRTVKRRSWAFRAQTWSRTAKLVGQYKLSRQLGGQLHRHVDFIESFNTQLPHRWRWPLTRWLRQIVNGSKAADSRPVNGEAARQRWAEPAEPAEPSEKPPAPEDGARSRR